MRKFRPLGALEEIRDYPADSWRQEILLRKSGAPALTIVVRFAVHAVGEVGLGCKIMELYTDKDDLVEALHEVQKVLKRLVRQKEYWKTYIM